MEELLQLWIVSVRRTKAKDHLRGQRVGVSSNMVNEQIWLLQHADQHILVFQILVWDVGLRGSDVQVVVDDLADHAPLLSVFLQALSNKSEGKSIHANSAYHEEHTIASAHDVAQIHVWTRGVDIAPLVEKVLDRLVRSQDDHHLGTENERVDRAILLRPLLELKVRFLLWHQVEIANDGQGWRSRWVASWSSSKIAKLEDDECYECSSKGV